MSVTELPTAWVTGAAGFIGSHLCTALVKSGWRVVALDNLQADHAPAGWQRLSALQTTASSRLQLKPLDLLHFSDLASSTLASLPWPDFVFHLAAQPGVRTTEDLDFYLQANLSTTEALIRGLTDSTNDSHTCARALPLIIFASSSSVYGDSLAGAALAEHHPCQPRSPYGQSKQRCEVYLARTAVQKGFKTIALRLFSVYGAYQRPDMAFQRWAHAILRQQPVILHDPHQMSRDFTYIDDVVQGFLKAAHYGKAMSQAYACFNIGSGVQTPLLQAAEQWLQQLENVAGKPLGAHIESRPAHRAEVLHTWANLEKSQQILSYQPRYTLTAGMAPFARNVFKRSKYGLSSEY